MNDKLADVAIIGAGPYGLSISASLSSMGIRHRIIGQPMASWHSAMPRGMLLKSEGCASSLYDPNNQFTLERYCLRKGLPYADIGLPISAKIFFEYGIAFQRELAPHVEMTQASLIERDPREQCFKIALENGATFRARKLIVAVGVSYFKHTPVQLTALPPSIRSHSGDYGDLSKLADCEVLIVGAGSSALDTAALLHELGAKVTVISRRDPVIMSKMVLPRSWTERARQPLTTIGPGWRSWIYTHAPLAVHRLPAKTRSNIVATHLGPGTGWFMRDRIEGRFPIHAGYEIESVEPNSDGRSVTLTGRGSKTLRIAADHVVSATGYRVDIGRLTFLEENLRAAIHCFQKAPVLSSSFESSVPGLFFAGPAAAASFGPVLRFVAGAQFTAVRIAGRLRHDLKAGALWNFRTVVADSASEPGSAGDRLSA